MVDETQRDLTDTWDRKIIHLDMDSFFYACERIRNPELAGKPVVIAGRGFRSVVTTASYEARTYGIGSGMNTDTALRLCPEVILVSPDKDYYRSCSQRVFDVVKEFSSMVEQVSVDECYIDMTDQQSVTSKAKELSRKIFSQTGLSASVGIGPNKLIAKVSSDAEKPNGFVIHDQYGACQYFADKDVSILPGVGPKTTKRLADENVYSLKQLRSLDLLYLQKHYGEKHGDFLYRACRFIDSSPVKTQRESKSKSIEHTLPEDVFDKQYLSDYLYDLTANLESVVKEEGNIPQTLGIKIKTSDFASFSRDKSIGDRSWHQTAQDLLAEFFSFYQKEYSASPGVRLLGVKASRFKNEKKSTGPVQGKLWED